MEPFPECLRADFLSFYKKGFLPVQCISESIIETISYAHVSDPSSREYTLLTLS